MPELPEVEYGRKIAETVALGRVIRSVVCERDEIVFDGVTARRMGQALRGRRVQAVRRHGKYLWWELDARPWPVFHFGMTGAFVAKGLPMLELAKGPRVEERWPPRFTKIRITFDDGGELVMTNARRLGRIRLARDPASEPPISKLGFDPLLEMPTSDEFRRRLARRKGRLKSVLLDQSFAAGVGNWIADEVAYQARIDPRRRVNELSVEEVEAVRVQLRDVIRLAVAVDAQKSKFPSTWLFHHRWGKREDARVDGHAIEHVDIGGRTTAWVPAVQR